MRRTTIMLIGVLVLASACSGPPAAQEGAMNIQQVRRDVIDRMRSVARVAAASDEQVLDARGGTRLCGDDGRGTPTQEFAADARLGPSEARETSRIEALAQALIDAGWQDTTPEGGDDFAQLRSDDVNLTIQPAVRRDGSRVGDGSLDLSFTSRCVRVAQGQVEQDDTDRSIELD